MGFFDKFKITRLKEGLEKTRDTLREKLSVITQGKTEIDDEFLEGLAVMWKNCFVAIIRVSVSVILTIMI